MAATVALYQNDIKKVLAWSTISQLGLMFLALGTGSYVGAMFHLTTHAFFKALLFLGAGSVITFLHHEQDLRKMGGLKKQMPFTYAAFLIGTLAIAGIPPLAGFFSKDEILLSAYAQGTGWWLAAVATSILTAFYMFRLLYLAFHGNYRGDVAPGNMKPTPLSMKFALFVLAALAIIGGFLGLPAITGLPHVMEHYLEPVFSSGLALSQNAPPSPITEWILMAVVLLMICVAIYVAFTVFVKRKRIPDTEPRGSFAKLLTNKYYSDEAYDAVFVKPHLKLSEQLHSRVELGIIDRLVEEVGKLVIRAGNKVRYLQSGLFSFYLFIMVISIILILLFNLIL
jgi:NADH-quinone oxidoreductase subunit L